MVPTSRILELYYSIKFSYTSNYDFFKYRGKLKNKYDGEHSRYYPQLLKIQKAFANEEEIWLHFSNMVTGDVFIALCAQDEHIKSTKKILGYLNNLESSFMDDLKLLLEEHGGFDQLTSLVKEKTMNAPILDLLVTGKIDYIFFSLLNTVMEFTKHWKSPVWKLYEKKVTNQGKFLRITSSHKLKCIKLLKEYLTQN